MQSEKSCAIYYAERAQSIYDYFSLRRLEAVQWALLYGSCEHCALQEEEEEEEEEVLRSAPTWPPAVQTNGNGAELSWAEKKNPAVIRINLRFFSSLPPLASSDL